MTNAICPGSFDPVTVGHLDIISRASKMFDHVVVLVIPNLDKTTSFSVEERMELLRRALSHAQMTNVEVETSDGLLAEYARQKNIQALVKGLRAVSDFEYEFQMALINKKLNPELETVFLTTQAENLYLSSSIVKQVATLGGDISEFVPACVIDDITKRLVAGKNKGGNPK